MQTMMEQTEDVASPATLCEAFQQTAARFAGEVALRTHGGSEEITWGEYAQRVRDVAGGLAALGIGRGDTVAMVMGNRPQAFVVDTAALHLGATPFSLYTTSSPEQLQYLLGHAESRVVVCEAPLAEKIMEVRPALPALEHVFVVDGPVAGARDFAELAHLGEDGFDLDAAGRAVTPEDVAVLIYTSGTTGPPKGVEITPRQRALGLADDDAHPPPGQAGAARVVLADGASGRPHGRPLPGAAHWIHDHLPG
jgi:long-subunit acyl-CoA synthetase (AMP-forming)